MMNADNVMVRNLLNLSVVRDNTIKIIPITIAMIMIGRVVYLETSISGAVRLSNTRFNFFTLKTTSMIKLKRANIIENSVLKKR